MDALWVRVALGVLFFMAISLIQVQSMQCWECNSKFDVNCADPFSPGNFLPTDCDMRIHHLNKTASICRKITQKVRGEQRVIRGCGYIKDERERLCYRRAGTFDVQVEFCECGNENGCNTATTTTMALTSKLLYLIPVLGFGATTQLWL